MERGLDVFLPVAEAPPHEIAEALADDPDFWLPATARRAGPSRWHEGTWTVEVRGLGSRRQVRCEVGHVWRTGQSVWRHLEWTPVSTDADVLPASMLPTLVGEIGVAVSGADASLVFSGHYDVPAGHVGVVLDVVGLGRVARRTVTHFLAQISVELARRASTRRQNAALR